MSVGSRSSCMRLKAVRMLCMQRASLADIAACSVGAWYTPVGVQAAVRQVASRRMHVTSHTACPKPLHLDAAHSAGDAPPSRM